ncbi:MAG: class I SAM-dependent methyltransferase [Elusimicrobia bacterium]|nr:class I SAM-dependent methyltransferase [Elusimicrobiota bacterium]
MACRREPGSFRDRNNRVFYQDGRVLRGVSAVALKDWQALSASEFFPAMTRAAKVIPTKRVQEPELGTWDAVLEHEAVPFLSYPYEWPFGMLKDAALLHLELMQAALREGMILKDSSAYNIQWLGAQPTFIDITSFVRLPAGEPWVGYRQFCSMFLYPLMLQAYRNAAFQPWMRGSLDGIASEEFNRILGLRDLWRPGVLSHVFLQAKLQGSMSTRAVKRELQSAGFPKELIVSNVRKLQDLISGLEWRQARSQWSEYAANNTYSAPENDQKAAFVRGAVISKRWRRVWDLGCNTGAYSRIAAENADYVVSMDADQLAVERFYQALKKEGRRSILPLVNNLVDPSPNLGWRGLERKSLPERGKPDLTLCLALIHHVVLSANVPLREFIGWLAELKTAVVIEFVSKEDPMVKLLLQNKTDDYADYDQQSFERYLGESFVVSKRQELETGTRTLYFAAPR